ncbi:tRNA lysidine(34) synthetase TilS [Rhizobium sp.]
MASSAYSPELAIDEFLNRLPARCRLLIAFSGGGDSTGLLAALSAARDHRPSLALHAATVDHGLRSGSAEEAQAAALTSHALAVPHAILTWTGAKPATGIQAAARETRYRLLADEAARIGADFVVAGHNLDDQHETIVMRRLRGPQTADGMDEAVLVMRRAWVLRPFLKVGRAAIRDYLRGLGLQWSEDPSNDNPVFERVRVRQSGLSAGDAGSIEPGPNPHADAAAFIRNHVKLHAGPVAAADLTRYDVRHPAHWTAIASLAAVLGGRIHGPDADAADALMERLASPEDFRMTADRVLFDRRGSMLYLHREERGLSEITIEPGDSALWDGRYEIVNGSPEPVTIGAGRALAGAPRLLQPAPEGALPRGVARRVAASTPRLVAGNAAGLRVRTLLAPFEKFLPARKLDLADSLAEALAAERFPSLSLSNGAF